MKRIIYALMTILILLGLTGCSLPGAMSAGTPTPSEAELSTKVALVMTSLPTMTATTAVEATKPLPTVQVTVAPENSTPEATAQAEPQATATASPEPQETTQPTAQNTPEPTATSTQPGPTPTASATLPAGDPRLKLGTPTFTDTMDSDKNWPTGDNEYTSISFSNGAMNLTSLDKLDGWRLTWPNPQNYYLEMAVRTTASCPDGARYGVIFRVPDAKKPDQGYLFGISCDGKYSLRRWNGRAGDDGEMAILISWTESAAILKGANQTNRLGLLVVDNRMMMYVNGTLLGDVRDNTYSSGWMGVFLGKNKTEGLSIQVEQLDYWENPSLP